MRRLLIICPWLLLACDPEPSIQIDKWVSYNEGKEIEANAVHPSARMRYKLIQSRVTDRNQMWQQIQPQLTGFDPSDYARLAPYIFDQDISTLQDHVRSGRLTYEKLIQWYLYRIVTYENDSGTYLNALISINPLAVDEARKCDREWNEQAHPIFGIPVLVKDNVNFAGLPTTAGAHALLGNQTQDAFIVHQIRDKGGIILGKTNLSEWANYLCEGCPNGYSAVGGQTLNPYGRKKHDTGGSSSGSGAAIAANYATVAIGTETSGSILSPSSASSLVGLKPTVGVLSRSGIVPISGTLDTPGPMTRTVSDNKILLSAMIGEDKEDPITLGHSVWEAISQSELKSLAGYRFGVLRPYMDDSVYASAVAQIEAAGSQVVMIEPGDVDLDGFGQMLDGEMLRDLPKYLEKFGASDLLITHVSDVLRHNLLDSSVRIPYGQARLRGVELDRMESEALDSLKERLHGVGRQFFDEPMTRHALDAVLSINNWTAGYAAQAQYPCLTLPMGYQTSGRPMGITLIMRPYEEARLLHVGGLLEKLLAARIYPESYP